ncbi:unnamed protein product [Linum tenue]|uniref:Uncharacterized protein n=1 Tax=Linum tenue TaxID=586396 RepID=A0AAV0MM42_9ROSI|nr:unnamed protein product [Linum tenue]
MLQSLMISFQFSDKTDTQSFHKLMQRAASLGLWDLRVFGSYLFMEYFDQSDTVFQSISTCGGSLENLELDGFKFSVPEFGRESWSGFRVLRELALNGVCFEFLGETELDPFADLPALEQLSLSSCGRRMLEEDWPLSDDYTAILVVNGPQLLTLELNNLTGFSEIRVSALELTSFTFKDGVDEFSLPTKVSLRAPALQHAALDLEGYEDLPVGRNKRKAQKQYAKLIHGLRRAESLVFKIDTTTAFCSACRLLRGPPSPFRRLKSLTLRHKEARAVITVDHQVLIAYFFGSSAPRIDYGDRVTMVGPSV